MADEAVATDAAGGGSDTAAGRPDSVLRPVRAGNGFEEAL
ncbi:GntR family transcriptional regulator, partial [Streptomyces sp. SID7499]|nr:GntR family transcriptional regulator [Streptomyces sp. SID7499]